MRCGWASSTVDSSSTRPVGSMSHAVRSFVMQRESAAGIKCRAAGVRGRVGAAGHAKSTRPVCATQKIWRRATRSDSLAASGMQPARQVRAVANVVANSARLILVSATASVGSGARTGDDGNVADALRLISRIRQYLEGGRTLRSTVQGKSSRPDKTLSWTERGKRGAGWSWSARFYELCVELFITLNICFIHNRK